MNIHKPLHPGVIVKDALIDSTGLTVTEASEKLGVSRAALGKSKPSQWSVSCALMVLGKSNSPIFDKVPCSIIIDLWLTPIKFSGAVKNGKEALNLFSNIFGINPTKNENIVLMIERFF